MNEPRKKSTTVAGTITQQALGVRDDANKPPVAQGVFAYFPRALADVARLSEFGSKKYAWHNWEGLDQNRIANALARHVLAVHVDPDGVDPETGLHHLVSVAWNALAQLELIKRSQGSEQAPSK